MATKARLDGTLAREMFAVMGDQAKEVLDALADMNDAHLAKHADDYWEAANRAGRVSSALADVFAALARGDYQKAARKLDIGE